VDLPASEAVAGEVAHGLEARADDRALDRGADLADAHARPTVAIAAESASAEARISGFQRPSLERSTLAAVSAT
jgi:hypothetical protein